MNLKYTSSKIYRLLNQTDNLYYTRNSLLLVFLMPSDVALYNRLDVFHEFHMLNKASKYKVITRNTFGVNFFCFITSQNSVIQALSIINCPAEPHLLPVLAKVKKMLAIPFSHACVETRVSLGIANMVYIRKTLMMIFWCAQEEIKLKSSKYYY